MTRPLVCRWNGDEMEPLPRFKCLANEQYVVGETYEVECIETASKNTRNHYFAQISDMWQTLPERYDGQFATFHHLRKYALIRTGYHNRSEIVCASKTAAQETAAFIRPIDEFSIVTVKECCVTRYTAQSQKAKAMGKSDFQASKQAVLEFVEHMLMEQAA